MQDPFEEHASHEENPLPLWRTIDEVSRLIGVTHDTIRKEVHKAFAGGAPWVKRAVNPTTDSTRYWLIDVTHEGYQAVARRWRAYAQRTSSSFQGSTCSDRAPWDEPEDDFCEEDEGGTASPFPPSQPLARSQPERTFEITTAWPTFCHQLAAQGLVVSSNLLAPKQRWQWSWQGYTAEGYESPTEAISAALHWRLLASNDAPEARFAEGETSQEEEPLPRKHRSWWQRFLDWL